MTTDETLVQAAKLLLGAAFFVYFVIWSQKVLHALA